MYKDINDESSFISSIDIRTTEEYMEKGIISGGMIPKMNCCVDALRRGTDKVAIIDGRVEHSLLVELFTNAGIGTMVTK